MEEQTRKVSNTVSVLANDEEGDIESLAVDDQWLYAVGSHSARPKRAKPVYEWDGRDRLAGKDQCISERLAPIGVIPPPKDYPKAKPEGIEILLDRDDRLRVVVVYDSAPVGAPTVFCIETTDD